MNQVNKLSKFWFKINNFKLFEKKQSYAIIIHGV
jgi:hypothetical protein